MAMMKACRSYAAVNAVFIASWLLGCPPAAADPLVDAEARIAEAKAAHGVSGEGVLVAVMDRGIDWRHDDFRRDDGTTRIEYLFDLTDDSGATAPGNAWRKGTIYTRQQIDAALRSGASLATRDADGHGTATAGLCCGNGRASGGLYQGAAHNAGLIVIKVVADGAPAHGNQPAEPAFFDPERIPVAIDFALAKGAELNKPLVMLLNLGSTSGPADGTSVLAKKIDAAVGPGIPGRAFVTGTGDDGGHPNHASGRLNPGATADLVIQKASPAGATLDVDLWYPEADRIQAAVTTPSGTTATYAAPSSDTSFDSQSTTDYQYFHYGSRTPSFGATYNAKRRLFLRLTGAPGNYTLKLTGVSIADGRFEASLNPARSWDAALQGNRFLTHAVQEKTIWDGATAHHNIAPNSYVRRTAWTDIDGVERRFAGQGAAGELWHGSSTGPTWDGRLGVDFAAPGDRVITSYAPDSWWATVRGNLVQGGAGRYGVAGAVSAAAPLTAGVVALMLEKAPHLDALEIKRGLQAAARRDAHTGTIPNPRWGHGKLDAKAALDRLDPPNQTALWWNEQQPGWGINLNHQGDLLFATLFTYDAQGQPMWLVMSAGARQPSTQAYSGDLYRTTGPAFNAQPFVPIGPSNLVPVGRMTVTFAGDDSATVDYSVNGSHVSARVRKQVFGSRAAVCRMTSAARVSASNFQDLWWKSDESGWGLNIAHQDDTLFATLFTYGADQRGMWLVMSAGLRQADGSYAGDLFRTAGTPFDAAVWAPATLTPVGTMRLRFTDGHTALLDYSVDGAAVSKVITRQLFSSPLPACSS